VRVVLWIAALSGIFLAFGWPFTFGPDPSSEAFHAAAVATLIALLSSIAAILATRR
jgi:hypothetical protein